ncbi:hypothetical protein ACTWPT_51440 [Nonomuraea sp. 3N208]|uniref:hypothetical protein n=1 Tax=Nonomuraea sp. 3N208 TaxID=3457421 RepID=UPI003FD1DB5E
MIRHPLAVVCLAGALLGCGASFAGSGEPASSTVTSPPGPSGETMHPAAERFHATELRPGDCIEPLPVDLIVTVVPCTVPHSAEFATTYVVPEGPWPGVAEVRRLSRNGCRPMMRYVPSRRDEVGIGVLAPAAEDWPRSRTSYCLAVPLDGGKLAGRVIL